MTDKTILKPCPFCGEEVELNPSPFAQAHCQNPSCVGRWSTVPAEPSIANFNWNTRVLEDALQKRIEEMKRLLEGAVDFIYQENYEHPLYAEIKTFLAEDK
jgi:hypothetical protein